MGTEIRRYVVAHQKETPRQMAKNGRGRGKRAAHQHGRNENHHQQRHGGKRVRQTGGQLEQASAPSAAFLAALEAQRAKQGAENAAVQPGSSHNDSRSEQTHGDSKRAAIPGYYFDETKKRYFKSTAQRPQERIETKTATGRTCLQVPSTHNRRQRGWLGYLADREASGALRSHVRSGWLGLPSAFVSARMSHSRLSRVDVSIDPTHDRFTAMSIDRSASTIVLGYGSGCVRSYHVESLPESRPQALGAIEVRGMTISSIRHSSSSPQQLLVSAVGAGTAHHLSSLLSRSSNDPESGCVALYPDGSSSLPSPSYIWRFSDPWVVEWSHADRNTFSVGMSGKRGAALVDAKRATTSGSSSNDDGVTLAPDGKIQSDTLSQSFSSQSVSPVIVNGSRNGSWWIWDTRSPRRAMEVHNAEANVHASLTCVRLLSDDRRVVMQSSNRQLVTKDLRSPTRRAVTMYASAEKHTYLPMLRFDLDDTESVLTSATSHATVGLYDVHRGTELARLPFPIEDVNPGRPSAGDLESVVIRESISSPIQVWALGRHTLARSVARHDSEGEWAK